MTTLREWTGTTLVTLGYNAAGNRSSATYANGAGTTYTYDKLGRLTGLTHDFAGTAQDVAYAYDYNPASQIASRTIGNDLYVFPKTATSIAYGVNGLNQYVQVAGGAVVHDPMATSSPRAGALWSTTARTSWSRPRLPAAALDLPVGKSGTVTDFRL